MTNLRQAAEETVKKLEHISRKLTGHRVWGGMEWEYHAILPSQYLPLRDFIDSQIRALRQALAEPDERDKAARDMIMYGQAFMKGGKHIPLENVIDRGAWSGVPDATKWVDELRGGDDDLEEQPNSATDVVEPIGEIQIEQMERPFNAGKVIVHFYDEPPPVGTKLYAAPPKTDLLNQTCCECGKSGGYALYCGDCWVKAREWQGLTAEDYSGMSIELANFASAVEDRLKKRNGYEN